jgi:hypothetical protein
MISKIIKEFKKAKKIYNMNFYDDSIYDDIMSDILKDLEDNNIKLTLTLHCFNFKFNNLSMVDYNSLLFKYDSIIKNKNFNIMEFIRYIENRNINYIFSFKPSKTFSCLTNIKYFIYFCRVKFRIK